VVAPLLRAVTYPPGGEALTPAPAACRQ
jgi:hypothetical protein